MVFHNWRKFLVYSSFTLQLHSACTSLPKIEYGSPVLHRTFSSSIWNSERGGILKKSYVKHTLTPTVLKIYHQMCLENSICNIKKKLLAIGNVILFSKYGRDGGEVGGVGVPDVIFFMKALAAFVTFLIICNHFFTWGKLEWSSLKYFALNCNFFISLVWKLVCLMCFLNAVCRGNSADHWKIHVNSSAGILGDIGSDCSTLRLCLVYLLKCTVFKNQT